MKRYQELEVKNFGPLIDTSKEKIKFKRCTIFIGDQGTGKSTIAKLYSTLTWLEKLFVAKRLMEKISLSDFKSMLAQQNIPKEYFKEDTEIYYDSNVLNIEIEKQKINIKVKEYSKGEYICPNIQYVPSERNLLSIATNLQNISGLPEMLIQYNSEFNMANKTIEKINFQNFDLIYDKKTDTNYIKEKNNNSKIKLTQASSGIQSIFPLLFVSQYQKSKVKRSFVERLKDTDENRRKRVISLINDEKDCEIIKNFILSGIEGNLKKIDYKQMEEDFSSIVNSCFVEIVEEPEQNLFPISQVALLKNIVKDTCGKGDKLIITTHSPYILSELNNYIFAEQVYTSTLKKIKEIDKDMFINYEDISAYIIINGKVKSIMDKEYGGIDVTKIDDCSRKINDVFDKLVNLRNDYVENI